MAVEVTGRERRRDAWWWCYGRSNRHASPIGRPSCSWRFRWSACCRTAPAPWWRPVVGVVVTRGGGGGRGGRSALMVVAVGADHHHHRQQASTTTATRMGAPRRRGRWFMADDGPVLGPPGGAGRQGPPASVGRVLEDQDRRVGGRQGPGGFRRRFPPAAAGSRPRAGSAPVGPPGPAPSSSWSGSGCPAGCPGCAGSPPPSGSRRSRAGARPRPPRPPATTTTTTATTITSGTIQQDREAARQLGASPAGPAIARSGGASRDAGPDGAGPSGALGCRNGEAQCLGSSNPNVAAEVRPTVWSDAEERGWWWRRQGGRSSGTRRLRTRDAIVERPDGPHCRR